MNCLSHVVRRLGLWVGCLFLPFLVNCNCDGTTSPFLRHMKRPLSMAPAFVEVKQCRAAGANIGQEFCVSDKDCPSGRRCVSEGRRYYMYVANADIDRLSVVYTRSISQSSSSREMLFSPFENEPGVLYIPTGRLPVDVDVAPDQTTMFVLHGVDGDLMVLDTRLQKPILKDGKALRVPADCKSKNTCWKSPKQLSLYQPSDGKGLIGFVALAGEFAVVAVNLDTRSPDFGKELKRFPMAGVPSSLVLDAEKNTLFATNASIGRVLKIDTKALTSETIQVGRPTAGGDVSPDHRWLYLIEQQEGGILIYDIDKQKLVPQGDERFPQRTSIQLENAAFLSVKFLSGVRATVRNQDGEEEVIEGDFAWASASDGYGYLLDTKRHTVFNAELRGPNVKSIRIFVGDDPFGDAREPNRVSLPRLKVDGSNEDDTGIQLVKGRVRTEIWTFVYEGIVVSGTKGNFPELRQGVFRDDSIPNFEKELVQKGDQLFLLNCKPAEDPDDPIALSPCIFPITEVKPNEIVVDFGDAKLEKAEWAYEIRSKESYVVRGSVSGKQKKRASEGVPYKNDFFEKIVIQKGPEATPRDTRIQFEIDSRFSLTRLQLEGMPSVSLLARDRLPCSQEHCGEDYCKNHPICGGKTCEPRTSDGNKNATLVESKKLCNSDEICQADTKTCVPQMKIWVLDSSNGTLYVVNPDSLLQRETAIR